MASGVRVRDAAGHEVPSWRRGWVAPSATSEAPVHDAVRHFVGHVVGRGRLRRSAAPPLRRASKIVHLSSLTRLLYLSLNP